MSITVEPICDSGTMPQQQPASHNNKRHTKPCVYYQTNSCPLSPDECDFAHIIAPPDLPYPLKAPSSTLRSKPCRFFVTGSCKQGVWCRFKHPAILAGAHQTDDIDLDSKRKKSWDDIIEEGGTIDYEKQKDDDAIDVRDIAPEWQAERSQHPKYRTRPCRNYYLGKCLYGDKCSYVHVLSLQQQQEQRQLQLQQQQQQSASWPAPLITSPATSPKWPTAPGFQPPPPSPNMYPSPIEPSTSPFDPEAIDSHSHSTDASSFASTPDIPALPPVLEERTDNSRRHMRGPPTSLTVLPGQRAYPQSYIQSPQGPMTIVHVPVAVPMFPQMVGQFGQRRAARPRSMSQPATTGSQGQGHRSVYYKSMFFP
ncbi:hypothetical protein BD410DRAFT_539916 [Rickenella mellea]|uniref:C3H1-type domain-containing protein n=1 Tax=Rickenella mellea TaxID=50990 RepID=A0A4Y7PQM8_9AGAM|nr:hypothetical protein BD410DRAFT_539916 [Rickenella mellea]